jgi:hypothetical protein
LSALPEVMIRTARLRSLGEILDGRPPQLGATGKVVVDRILDTEECPMPSFLAI